MKVYVDVSQVCLSSYQSPEMYGEWSASYSSSVQGVYTDKVLTKSHGVEEFECDCKAGDVVYVVSVIYGTGDSFGHSDGEIDIVGVFNNIEDSKKLSEHIESYDKNTKYSNKVELSDGIFEYFCPWLGYFETFEYVSVEAFIVK